MSRWLVSAPPAEPVGLHVVAVPFAGGGSASYVGWRRLLPSDVSLTIVRLPGRESRFTERPRTDLSGILDELVPAVLDLAPVPIVVFGYSLGALIGYELAVRMTEVGRAPLLLAVGGCDAPHRHRPTHQLSQLDDQSFVEALRRLEGTPAEIFEHPELLEIVLPALRADFTLVERYVWSAPAHKLGTPITTYCGSNDSEVTATGVAAWSELTHAPARNHTYQGGHFFLTDSAPALVSDLLRDADWAGAGSDQA